MAVRMDMQPEDGLVEAEHGPQQLLNRPGELGLLPWWRNSCGGTIGVGVVGGGAAQVRHGHAPGGEDRVVELVNQGLELQGVVKRAAAVPHGLLILRIHQDKWMMEKEWLGFYDEQRIDREREEGRSDWLSFPILYRWMDVGSQPERVCDVKQVSRPLHSHH